MAAPLTVKEETNGPMTIRIQFNSEYRKSTGNGSVVLKYKTHTDEQLRRIFLDFCDRLDLIYDTIRFTYDGTRIRETDTPNRYEMEDDDLVDAFTDMTGAGGAAAC